ncbi:transcriptional regulator [Chryseobacterium daecheongense]|uniref:Transcriptional regulator n=1 Tax=Chryseobacterium daecheongense TaxID=192389 RepID=A0A3N0W3Q0_9FLAO|nr:transcriptional regulator [Chryseobacterium daecheongense]ROH99686.1 transcriptional regulator [Chryseobacterium daecheongense]TDX95398.1 DNA-binding transcriptional regulator GbsR (MarR family) [Chryseobacterium daecheongense]
MQQSIEIDEKIFQDAVRFYGTIFNIPPLASKIYAYLNFDFEKVGVTFDEFVEVFSASKSSVSTSISLLLNAQLIVDHNKMDERKRYFFINDEYRKIRFEKIVQKMQDELKLIDDLNKFKKGKEHDHDEKMEVYISLLNKSIKNIQESLNKL